MSLGYMATQDALIVAALDSFRIEIPSWGFANTGTRFGKYLQPAAAFTIEEKLSDAGMVHQLTGVCPSIALHVRWDLPNGMEDANQIAVLSKKFGVRPGSINPNLFEEQHYRFGSFGNPNAAVRALAVEHVRLSIQIAERLRSPEIALWFADGSDYPGSANIRHRKQWFEDCLRLVHGDLSAGQRLLVEYKPFEPAFYHTDIADWGMALLLARAAGPQARVLVDTGHHYSAQNIEQVVAWLLSENMLGGFHFNDRRYADDDLTLGSIDPYQAFRIFHEILSFEWESNGQADIAYMIDQSHNSKGKIEATIQTVMMAQELYAKAALVNRAELAARQMKADVVSSERLLQDVFASDVRPMIRDWRLANGLPADPLQAFLESGYLDRITRERSSRNAGIVSTYA